MKPFSRIIAFLFLALALVSCGEDVPVPVPEPGGPDSYVGIARKFTFGPEVTGFVYKNYTLRLKAPDGSLISRPGSHQRSADVSEFTLDTGLADGRYVMTLATPEGAGIGGRLMADFADSRLRNVAFTLPAYMLDGDGTADSPYIISDDDSFNMFINNLTEDEANGAGLYFRQTADVVPSDQSSYAPGRGYWGAPFAGDYDGAATP